MKDPRSASGDAGAQGPGTARAIPCYAVAVVLAAAVLFVYWQVGGHDFINIDDNLYVYENPVVLRGLTMEGASWAFSTFHASNWHPLTWLSHMLDVELFGPSPGWHHGVSALLHLLNTELLFFVLWRMTGGLWASAFVAALFGVHPLHAESVAWVAERKDVLSTLFWILSMGAYLHYVRRPGVGRYVLVMAAFTLGLLSKPMLVTLPFVLLLLDYWPLGRMEPSDASRVPSWRSYGPALLRLTREKAPLLVLSAMSCAVTYMAQGGSRGLFPSFALPFGLRVANAFVSYATYLWKTVWPSSLGVIYLHPAALHDDIPAWEIAAAVALLCGLSALAVWQARRRPWLAAGWLWYLGTLVPVIGLVQIGIQAHADRYTYVPLIGIFIAAAWAVPPILPGRRFRRLALGTLAGAVLAALATAGRGQAGYWRDSVTLLTRTVAVTDRNWPALHNLGSACVELGQYERAVAPLREALRIKPYYVEAWMTLGLAYEGLGRHREAIGYFRAALRFRPGDANAWNILGVSCGKLGDYAQAVDCFQNALRLRPDDADTWNNLGLAHESLGRVGHAVECYREALRIRPDHVEARNNLAEAFRNIGRSR